MKEEIILIGGGGHAKSVIDSIKNNNVYKIKGIIDTTDKIGYTVNGVPIIGTDTKLKYYYKIGIKKAFITLGSIGNIKLRVKLFKQAKEIGFVFPNIIDNTAILSKHITLGKGCYIGKGSIINTNVKIGNNVIINSGSLIEHDCKIESFVHVAPMTTICGGVNVGYGTHIGANSSIINNINVGKHCLIGIGSVVIRDISNNIKAYGNPCTERGKHE